MTFALLHGSSAQGHTVVEGAVVTDDRGLADHHTHTVIDEEAAPHLGPWVGVGSGLGVGTTGSDGSSPRRSDNS